MDLSTDFKTKFFNLEGVHYNERKKNFYKLLHSTDLHVLTQNIDIQPRNYLEDIFYVDILIRAKQIDRLLEMLKEGNGVLTSRILKQKWFFEDAFKSMSEDMIVNEFLPMLSFSLRMKVLKKMSLSFSEGRMDIMFDNLLGRYGLFIAQQFLFSCSPAKIMNVLRTNEINLSGEQLKRMLDKDSNLIKIYLEEYQKNTGKEFDNYEFLSYIIWKYPNLYFQFKSHPADPMKIGKRTTKAILKIDKQEALKHVTEISGKLNMSAVTREVKDFDKEYLHKYFPPEMNQLDQRYESYTLRRFLKKYPVKNRWSVFSNAFRKAYNADSSNHLDILDEQIAVMFAKEIKQKWAEIKYQKTNALSYMKYLEPQKAFVLLKEKLNVTADISARSTMLQDMILICHTNQDYNSYEEVLKYIYARHRNDDKYLRDQILSKIQYNTNFELSTETFWKHVNELIELGRTKGEELNFGMISQYLIFLSKKQLPLDEAVAQYVKDCASQKFPMWHLFYFDKEPKIEAQIIKHILKCLHTIPITSQEKLIKSLMDIIMKFNRKQSKDLWIEINNCPVLLEMIENALKNKESYNEVDTMCIQFLIEYNYSRNSPKPIKFCDDTELFNIVKKMAMQLPNVTFMTAIKKPRHSEFQENLLDYYFTELIWATGGQTAIKYCMKEEPDLVAKYFDVLLPLEVSRSALDFNEIKLYSHLGLVEKLINHFKPLVLPENTCVTKKILIEKLSKIMPTGEFIEQISAYVPQKTSLESMDSEEKKLYEVQCAVVKVLKNLSEYPKLVPLLYSFCQGDFLQQSLPLLYKSLYRINEELAMNFIKYLMEKAVSARKHAMFLSFEVLPQKTSLDLFQIVATREKNISAKKYLFQALLKYFLKNPSENLLTMVVANMTFIDKNDKELLDNLTNSLEKVPGKFKPIFIEQLWNFLDIMEQKGVVTVENKKSLLSNINGFDVTLFSQIKESFCQSILNRYFLSSDNTFAKADKIKEFAAKYLLVYRNMDFVFDIIKKYKQLHWEANDKKELRQIFNFFNFFYRKYASKDIELLKLFKSFWEHEFSHEECFAEYLQLRLMVLYKENTDMAAFSKTVNALFQELVSEYGPYINDLLLESIEEFLQSLHKSDYEFLTTTFGLELLKCDTNEFNCYIVSSILPLGDANKHKELRLKVIDLLKSVDSFSVRIRYNNLVKK